MNPLDARRRLLGRNVYKRTTEGNPAIAQGSLARRYPGITMQGWTEQAQYEGNNLFDINGYINDYNSIKNEDGSITIKSYAVGLKNKISDVLPDIKVGDVLYISATNGTLVYIGGKVSNINQNSSIEITESVLQNNTFGFYGDNNGEITISDITISKKYGEPYEPYTGGQPSPNPDYPQEITSAGKYNEGTGKYEYEITIANAQTDATKNQTVTLTANRPLTKWDKLEKRNGQWGWVYKSAEIESYTDESVPGEYYSTTGQLSTGAQVWYETTTETFVPLTASEQEAMNALYTFRPTTVLSNDCECEMTLTYKTKKSLEVTT